MQILELGAYVIVVSVATDTTILILLKIYSHAKRILYATSPC